MSETYTVVGYPKAAHWRQPRARLLINGTTRDETPLEGFTLSRTRYARCDTAELTLAINRTLLAQQDSKWFDVSVSAGQTPPDINVAIEMREEAHTGAQWRTVFSGIVDKVRWTPDQTQLEVECRDMLAKLMDMRVQMAWLNQTGPDVLNAIIKQAGLTPQASFPANMTGQFWQVEHKRTSASAHHKFQTAFDLARYIADEFGCDLYADGNTIVCHPALSPGASSAVIHPFDYSDPGPDKPIRASAAQMMLERDYVTSKNVMVHVMSWDSRRRAVAETWFSAEGHSRTQSENMGTLYTFRVPGARQDDVERIAEAKYNQIVAHDRTISLTLPGRITLEPRHFMSISGTGSSWDMPSGDAYTVDAVETTWSWDQMFIQKPITIHWSNPLRICRPFARIGDVVVSPRLAGLEQTDWSPLWEGRLLDAVNRALSALDTLREAVLSVTKALSLPQNNLSHQRLEQIRALCSHLLLPHAAAWSFTESARETRDVVLREQESVTRCHALTADLDTRWKDSIRALPLAETLAEWRTVKEKWLLARSMGQKAIRKRLEPHAIALPEDCESDLEALVERATLLEKLTNASHKTSIGPMWRGLDTDFDAINATFDWGQETRTRLAGCTAETGELLTARAHLRTLLAEGQDLLAPGGTVHASLTRYLAVFTDLDAALKTLGNCGASDVTRLVPPENPGWLEQTADRLRDWKEAARELRDWCSWRRAYHQAAQLGLTPMIEGIEHGLIARNDVLAVFEANYARWWTMHAVSDSALLSGFVAATHEGRIVRFRELDEKLKTLAIRLIRARLAGRIPGEAAGQHDPEYKVLTREIAKKTRHLPVRQLAEKMPGALRTLTPCLMMSPLSVAQYLPADAAPFDLVIFDEASQIATWDAIGAIGRGKQVIVVGDPKQLPPTDFFTAGLAAADAHTSDEMTDLDSILDECLGAGVPAISLEWHYRSRHESLIAFSNQAYYGGDLVTFPSPVTADQAVSFRFVPKGIYEPGKNGSHTNPAEARMKGLSEGMTAYSKSKLRRCFRQKDGRSRHRSVFPDSAWILASLIPIYPARSSQASNAMAPHITGAQRRATETA